MCPVKGARMERREGQMDRYLSPIEQEGFLEEMAHNLRASKKLEFPSEL